MAAQQYKAALAITPDAAGIHVQLGQSLKESGDFDGAEAAYLHALQLTPDGVDIHVQLGHIYQLRGDIPKALRHYRSAQERGSRDPHMLSYLATSGLAAPLDLAANDESVQPQTSKPGTENGFPVFDFQVTALSRPRKEGDVVVFTISVDLKRIDKGEFTYLARNRNLRIGCQVYSGTSDTEVIADERGVVTEDKTSATSLIVTFSLPAALFMDRACRLMLLNFVYDGKFWFSERGRPSTYAAIGVTGPEKQDLFQYYLENFNADR